MIKSIQRADILRSSLLIVVLATYSCIAQSHVPQNDPDAFRVRMFGGNIFLPSAVSLEANAITQGIVRFSTLYEPNSKNTRVIATIGVIEKDVLKAIEGSDHHAECYGFRQAFTVISHEPQRMVLMHFYDENMYLSLLAEDEDIWRTALSDFIERSNDHDGSCISSVVEQVRAEKKE